MSRSEILESLFQKKAVAVLRVKEKQKLKHVIEAIYAGGISVMEITMTVPNAIDMIKQITGELSSDILVGVGTVLNSTDAAAAVKAGAKFVVSPVFDPEIIDAAHELDVPVMPGCFTPTEIFSAYNAGADIIKVFPADVLGMAFFKGILAPMPFLKLMPTGGVTLTNGGQWMAAGACAVGIGSALTDKKALAEGNYQLLTENARTIINSINS